MQRFRAVSKVDGEAAYCLVNLEAAITFLETVDLASLRSDEPLSGPPKSESRPTTPHLESQPHWISRTSNASPDSSTSAATSAISDQPASAYLLETSSILKPAQSAMPSHQRKLSNLFQPPASALGVASGVVRTTADQGFKTIGNTLDNSFKRKPSCRVVFTAFMFCLESVDMYEEQDTPLCYSDKSTDSGSP